jgi:thiamine pyrophosphokinase
LRAVIFANGVLTDATNVQAIIQPDDIVIAADGGTRYCKERGLIPKIAIGDMDSVSREEAAILEKSEIRIVRYPCQKDYTDLEIAIQTAQDFGVNEIIILGGMGERWDMSIANVLLMTAFEIPIRLIDGPQEMRLLRGGNCIKFHGKIGDTLSLIPVSQDAQGVSSSGLQYSLKNDTLKLGATRGLSNVLTEATAEVCLEHGNLVCVFIEK